jgi:hypothetical protein
MKTVHSQQLVHLLRNPMRKFNNLAESLILSANNSGLNQWY